MSLFFIAENELAGWIEKLAGTATVIVPVRQGNSILFRPYTAGVTPDFSRMPTEAAKKTVFPQSETLLEYSKKRDAETGRVSTEVKETLPEGKVILFGSRPCGTRGLTVMDRVYNTERLSDPYFTRRRENSVIVTMACNKPEKTCFCNWVGSHPADEEGSDVLLTPVEGGYVAKAVTETGAAILEGFPAAGDKEALAKAVQEAAREMLGEAENLEGIEEKLIQLFGDTEFWGEQAEKCLACGACTYLCPTCYCFDITDEDEGRKGRRVRSWDACMSTHFTLEASGHNPRNQKGNRLRNRVGHKFSYYSDVHNGVCACNGCGRCIKSCPVGLDIREVVKDALAKEINKTEEGSK